MTEVPILQKPVYDLLRKLVDWFLYDRDLRHEGVKAVMLKKSLLEESLSSEVKIRIMTTIRAHAFYLLGHLTLIYLKVNIKS